MYVSEICITLLDCIFTLPREKIIRISYTSQNDLHMIILSLSLSNNNTITTI